MKQYTVDSRRDSGYREQRLRIVFCFPILCFLFTIYCLLSTAYSLLPAVFAEDNPLNRMRDETISYFKSMTGNITTVDGKKVIVNLGTKDAVKKGMRFNILREEAPFKHPVTKEPLGKMESLIGKLEIREVNADSSAGDIIEGDAKEGDKVRVSEIKVNLLFCQSKDIDWHLADSYYRNLKDAGRFTIIDTGIDTENPSKIIEEAKRLHAEVALLLVSKKAESGTLLTQRLYWVSDGLKFSETEIHIDTAFAKELKFGEEFFKSKFEDARLQLDIPIAARLMTLSDVDGDGKQEIVLGTDKEVRFYTIGVDLHPAFGGIKIDGSGFDNYLWLDSIDLNKNGRDEIIITSMKDDDIISYIYELKGSEFVLLYRDRVFMRRIENRLIAQSYSRVEGFEGDVYNILWEGEYKKGNSERLPKGVNIYDFTYFHDPQTGKLLLSYDEKGFLSIHNDKYMEIWRSKTKTGGFLTTFKKAAPSAMVESGEWAIKDRVFLRNKDILSVQRIPLFEVVKGFGYKKSQIKNLRWNGLSMEEGILIDNIKGTLFDYTVSGDKIIVISSPPMGIKPENILKGENPIKTELSIYLLKGM